jgi:hypothetical protein
MDRSSESQEIWVFSTLVAGFALSFLIAVVPHFNGAYRLEPLMLAAWMIPYIILSVIVWFLRGPVRLRTILGVVWVQLLTGLIQRVILGDPVGLSLFVMPLVTAVGLLLLIPQLCGRIEEGPLGPICVRILKAGD